MASDILNKRKGISEDVKFDDKIIKIYKAFKLMEQQKTCDPFYSESLDEIVSYMISNKNILNDTSYMDKSSQFSSMNELYLFKTKKLDKMDTSL